MSIEAETALPASLAEKLATSPQYQWAIQQQQANALPRTGFYDPGDSSAPSAPGTLIRRADAEYEVEGETLPALRMLYWSQNSAGMPVAAAGVVLQPPGSAPRGGWPLVVNAHGVSGMSRASAPSLMRDLYHGDQMKRFLEQGWAVVAPDYAGLGTDGHHELGNAAAAAADLRYGLHAARQAVPHLAAQWVLWGHSQGGAAALALAERLLTVGESGYAGAVVTSPAADLARVLRHAVQAPGLGALAALFALGAQRSHREFQAGHVLTPQAMERLPVVQHATLGAVVAAYGDLSGTDLVRSDYLDEPRFARFLADNSTGRGRVAGPVLLLQGEADVMTPLAFADALAAQLCQAGTQLDYRTYPDLGHDTYPDVVQGIDDGAMPDILAWIAARFAGRPAATNCAELPAGGEADERP